MKRKLWIILFFLLIGSLQAKYVSVKNEKQFHNEMNDFEFALVAFIPKCDGKDGKAMKNDISFMKKTIKSIAESQPFKKDIKGEMGFIIIDSQHDDLADVIKKYEIELVNKPIFVLFKNSKPITGLIGQLVELSGYVDKADLLAFIDDYFGKDIDDILAKKSDEQAQEREMQLARLQSAATPRYPYGFYSPFNPWGSPSPYLYTGYASFYPYGYSYNGYNYFIP